jgi:hypothetical protein
MGVHDMCRQACDESSGVSGECCCSGTLQPEEEIRMLEAMKTLEKIRLDAMDRRIEDLRRAVTK